MEDKRNTPFRFMKKALWKETHETCKYHGGLAWPLKCLCPSISQIYKNTTFLLSNDCFTVEICVLDSDVAFSIINF